MTREKAGRIVHLHPASQNHVIGMHLVDIQMLLLQLKVKALKFITEIIDSISIRAFACHFYNM